MKLAPMEALAAPELPEGPEWRYEPLKDDGFRALAYVEGGRVRLVYRRGTAYKSFPGLCSAMAGGRAVGTAPTRPEATTWVKIKNPAYSQEEGRRDLFQKRAVAA